MPITEVDATIEKELAERFKIEGFPTLKLLIDGKPVDYSGEREEEDIYNFIKKRQESPVKAIDNMDEIDKLKESKLAVLLIQDFEETDEMFKNYTASAYEFENITFYSSKLEGLKAKFNINEKYAFILFRNFDDGMKIF